MGRQVQIDLESSIDTYMYLIAGNGSGTLHLASDDDGGESLNSRITQTLAPGTYTIAAATYAKNQTGAYTCASAGIDDVRDGDSRGHAAWLITRDGGTMLPEHRGI